MKKSIQDLRESTEKHHVLAFGRMNPPTVGHEKLVAKVHEVAEKHHAGHTVVLSHSQDPNKNPLPAKEKLKHAKRFFPHTNLEVSDKKTPTYLKHAEKLHKNGVTHLHMVAGGDRTAQYDKDLHHYNGKHKGALFNFKKIQVHSAGERDPDAEGVEGMSASKMREAAKKGDFKSFKQGVPKHVKHAHAHEMYNDVRHHSGLKEELIEGKFYIPDTSALPYGRNAMPQINHSDMSKFRLHLNQHGISSSTEVVPATSLGATQAEFSTDKIKSLMHPDSADILRKPILVSQDNYVLDGHHRWLANYNKDTDATQNIIRLNAGIHALVPLAKMFPGAERRDINEETNLSEGLHDPGIFKAIFMAGGPGSGKDFVLKRVVGNFGFVEVSSDPFLSHLMHQEKLDLKMPEHESEKRDKVRVRAKQLEHHKKQLVIKGRLGIILNGVADDFAEIAQRKKEFEELGYDTMMIGVDVSDEESRRRNIARGEMGGRTVPENIRAKKWQGAHANLDRYATLFGRNYVRIDNSVDVERSPPDQKAKLEADFQKAFKKIREFVSTKPSKPSASSWIHMQQAARTGSTTHMEDIDQLFEAEVLSEHSAGESGQYRPTQSAHVIKRLGTRHGRGKTPGTQWSMHHRASNTATPPPKQQKPVGALRKEAADTFGYDYDTRMASTVPSGVITKYKDEDKKTKKAKPLSSIIKESNEYIENRPFSVLENTDDLLE
jgi:hypothetical protein